MPDHPSSPKREGLRRSVPFELVRAEGETGDGHTIDGYGAVFGQPTRIDSWEGTFDEVISQGAFRKSLRERTPIMQFDHGQHPMIGSIPLGRWETVEEDEHGLRTVGRLSDNWLVQPVRDAIRDGGVTGMSFRFAVVRDEWTDKDGKKLREDELPDLLYHGARERGPLLRTLKEVRVSEVGPVTWPAYDSTSVDVRSSAERFIVDLGRLDLRTEQARSELARAVDMANRAVALVDPQTSDTSVSDSQSDLSSTPIEPRSTANPAADEHSEQEPPVTAKVAAGEHSSAVQRRCDRQAALEKRRAILKSIPKG